MLPPVLGAYEVVMIIIGEKINPIRKDVARAIKERDANFIQNLARTQVERGAEVLDINGGTDLMTEADDLAWLVEATQEAVDVPLAVDAVAPEVLARGLQACRDKTKAWVNSATLDDDRFEPVLGLAKEHGARLIALPMRSSYVPKTVDERLDMAKEILERAERQGFALGKLYIDCLVQPVCIAPESALACLEFAQKLAAHAPAVGKLICLTAVSFALPRRRLLNRCFLAMLVACGLEAVILDPLDRQLMESLAALRAILGQDEFCIDYVQQFRPA